jgi:streptogramin lyase
MALVTKASILPARPLIFLAMALFLWGCGPTGLGEQPVSSPISDLQNGELLQLAIAPSPSPFVPTFTPVSDSLPDTSGALPASQENDSAAQLLLQTISARATGTETARETSAGLAATAPVASNTPSPGTPVPGSPTPTPVSLLARFFAPLASFDSVLPGLLNELRVGPDGALWVSNENGIASLQGSSWRVHFSDVSLWIAGFDGAGRTWLINEQGTAVLSWDGREWRIYGDGAGWLPVRWPNLLTQGEEMAIDRTGRVWMTAFQDVRSFDGREWTVHNLRDIGFAHSDETADYDGFFFPAIAQDLQGNIWVGNCDTRGEELAGQGVRWFDGTTWLGNSEPTAAGCVRDIAVDAQGRVWLGIDDILWRYDPALKNWTSFELPEQAGDTRIGWIQEIRFGPSGNPWLAVALCGGASCGTSYLRYQYQQDKWIAVPQPDDTDPGRMFIDAGGNAWIFAEKKLFLAQGENLLQVLGIEICCITQDRAGWLYLGAKQDKLKLIFIERGER